MRLRSHVAVAVVQAGRYSSKSTPSLGTSICCGFSPKKQNKTTMATTPSKKKKKKKEKTEKAMNETNTLRGKGNKNNPKKKR